MNTACHPGNYAKGRGGTKISYIVIHYTANDGDTAAGNCSYFANNVVKASAHHFVDEHGARLSVSEGDTAWHCGAQTYRHSQCRNANSIGIELCSRKNPAGHFEIPPKTIANAQLLVRSLLSHYALSPDRVLRHYDVTGKICPMPFVESQRAWVEFLEGLVEKKTVDQPPATWAVHDAAWAVEAGIFRGDAQNQFRWHDPVTRQELAVILHRLQK